MGPGRSLGHRLKHTAPSFGGSRSLPTAPHCAGGSNWGSKNIMVNRRTPHLGLCNAALAPKACPFPYRSSLFLDSGRSTLAPNSALGAPPALLPILDFFFCFYPLIYLWVVNMCVHREDNLFAVKRCPE